MFAADMELCIVCTSGLLSLALPGSQVVYTLVDYPINAGVSEICFGETYFDEPAFGLCNKCQLMFLKCF